MMYMSTSLLVLKENRIAGVKWSIVRSIVHSIQVVGICLRMLQPLFRSENSCWPGS